MRFETTKTPTVLVAEDDNTTRLALVTGLINAGYDVRGVSDGAECVQAIKENPPDILILDWVMPEMTGLEVCRYIRANPVFDSCYIILLTIKGATTDRIEAFDNGADDFLTKPVAHEELFARMRAALRIQSLNRDLKTALNDLQRDVSAAAAVQRELLPKKDVILPPFRFAWKFIPCETIAGDLFDIFPLDEQHIAVYMYDVSGHGVASAMLSASLHNVIALSPIHSSITKEAIDEPPYYRIRNPHETIRILNERYKFADIGLYFTMFYGVIHRESLHLRYCRAGHIPPFIIRDGNVRDLEPADVPVGLMDQVEFVTHEFQFKPSDRMVLYSDGVTEAVNARDESFMLKRAVESLTEAKDEPLDKMIERLTTDVRQWQGRDTFGDDLTVLAMEIDNKDGSV